MKLMNDYNYIDGINTLYYWSTITYKCQMCGNELQCSLPTAKFRIYTNEMILPTCCECGHHNWLIEKKVMIGESKNYLPIFLERFCANVKVWFRHRQNLKNQC